MSESTTAADFRRSAAALDPRDPRYATEIVDRLISASRSAGASDVHMQPTPEGLALSWRLDGVLHPVGVLPAALAPNIVARLKVLADLLTYRTDTPQEGRIRARPGDPETRVSTFPTLHGERAVMRLFGGPGRYLRLADLGYPPEVDAALGPLLTETSGLIVVAGPAGSGKTTTLYACLRELAEASGGRRSLVTLEDPIEVAVPGVAQSQVNEAAGLALDQGLRSLLRQDPEVIAVGEIRDARTAEVAFQAALTGHLVLTTFHAGGAAEAVGRLADMGIEPYLLRSGLRAIVAQRLVRRLCPACSRPAESEEEGLDLPTAGARVAAGCEACGGTGYAGRLPLVELMLPGAWPEGKGAIGRSETRAIEGAAVRGGMTRIWERALAALGSGQTSAAEIRRVLGLGSPAREATVPAE
jgi:type II secretory ATPase GspE/PulE/Tfp pilus assembly ATPase PilB-like protein